MKAIVSSTNDPKYSFFLPIVAWCWNKLNVDVICFVPGNVSVLTKFAMDTMNFKAKNRNLSYGFICPEHKEATYAQVSRLFVGCLDLPPTDTAIITSDIDMLPFGDYLKQYPGDVILFGADLLEGQEMYPICYCSMTHKTWQEVMNTGGKTLQECLDEQLGQIEVEHFRGNYWCFDQELLYKQIQKSYRPVNKFNRAKLPERFATRRLDRDDSFLLQKLSPDIIDYHMPRPGYEEKNFNQILTVLKYFYPNDDFQWLIDYKNAYTSLL